MGLRLRHHCGLRRLRHARHHLHPPGAVLALALGAGLMLVVATNYSYLSEFSFFFYYEKLEKF